MDVTRKRKTWVFTIVMMISFWSITTTMRVSAYQVPTLPGGNLINNPWFRSASDPNYSGLDGWTDAAGKDKYWSTSQKQSNPSPDIILNAICGNKPVYCGTSGKLKNTPGQTGGVGVPGVNSYLYQVVAANPTKTKLVFFSYWVSHNIDPAEVLIFGSDSPNGPWGDDPIWVPFNWTQLNSDQDIDLWTNTGILDKIIPQGYSYYKIVIHARLPDDDLVGFKITGIYFTALAPGDPIPPVLSQMNFIPVISYKR